jgi:hypothetical protein
VSDGLSEKHWSRDMPFRAACGADDVGQTTTSIRENVTCETCRYLMLAVPSAPATPACPGCGNPPCKYGCDVNNMAGLQRVCRAPIDCDAPPTPGRAEDLDKQIEAATPTAEEFAAFRETHKPPQSWYDENMEGLFVAAPAPPGLTATDVQRLQRNCELALHEGSFESRAAARAAAKEMLHVLADRQRLAEERHHALNLLARIHADGGHYTDEHGFTKSCQDADAKWLAWMDERDRLTEEAAGLRRACRACRDQGNYGKLTSARPA